MTALLAPTTQIDVCQAVRRPGLTVVVVNFNAWPDVARLVTMLADSPALADGRCEIVVIDNASDDPVPAELERPRVGVRLILRSENGGFAAGVNAGWHESRGRWLLLVNPDVVAGPDLIEAVLARMDRIEARGGELPGVVGFGLRNPDGSRQGSVGVEPSLARVILEAFLPRSRRKYKVGWQDRPGPVPWVTGACALVHADLLARLGGMDEDFFLYHEEVALCRSSRALGRSVEYDPTIEVVHLRPLQSRSVSPVLRIITRHSKLLYFRKYRYPWEFRLLSRLVQTEAAIRGAWSAIRGRRAISRSWWTIARMAGDMRGGNVPRGREVRALAESVAAPRHEPMRGIAGAARSPFRRRPRRHVLVESH